jgi:hypothetical protein
VAAKTIQTRQQAQKCTSRYYYQSKIVLEIPIVLTSEVHAKTNKAEAGNAQDEIKKSTDSIANPIATVHATETTSAHG